MVRGHTFCVGNLEKLHLVGRGSISWKVISVICCIDSGRHPQVCHFSSPFHSRQERGSWWSYRRDAAWEETLEGSRGADENGFDIGGVADNGEDIIGVGSDFQRGGSVVGTHVKEGLDLGLGAVEDCEGAIGLDEMGDMDCPITLVLIHPSCVLAGLIGSRVVIVAAMELK
ncbi:hypothetical protein NE237_028910 [Protea cynaroides]|uniref:Uncharacterized protein n=1 Tax=Protea cynaroides TaxID=273540 RepID=A0A9Q0GQV1_9MAGN|nr:hypothetical protein NE237_028910 [Protea cynaroides]